MEPIKEVHLDRIFNAPVETVWKAWTDPALLKQWWGPDNVSIDECEVDLRVGGRVYIVMVAGEAMGPYKGTRWPMEGNFTIIEENTQLSYTAKAWTDGQEGTEIETITNIVFMEENGKTHLKLTSEIHKMGPGAQFAAEGMQAGFTQQFAKLEKFLA